jgi:hypothetical protein
VLTAGILWPFGPTVAGFSPGLPVQSCTAWPNFGSMYAASARPAVGPIHAPIRVPRAIHPALEAPPKQGATNFGQNAAAAKDPNARNTPSFFAKYATVKNCAHAGAALNPEMNAAATGGPIDRAAAVTYGNPPFTASPSPRPTTGASFLISAEMSWPTRSRRH